MSAGRFVARLLPPALALGVALLVGVGFMAAIGQDPWEVMRATGSAVFASQKSIVTNVGTCWRKARR